MQFVNSANTMLTATPKNKINLPVLKAWERVFELLDAICDHEYDRDGFEKAILHLFGGDKSSKSVFRGMAIPTLRNLGLIVGYGSVIRASANGLLIHTARKERKTHGMRALRAVLFEIDNEIGVLSSLLGKSTFVLDDFVQDWLENVKTSDIRRSKNPKAKERAARERLLDWIKFLTFAEILYNDGHNIRIDETNYESIKKDLDVTAPEKTTNFKPYLFVCYKKIVFDQKGIGTISIEDLRRAVAVTMYQKDRTILTERQFDQLLSELPKMGGDYVITLGRSMGADEKLYYYQGKYYQSLFIRTLTKEEVNNG
jgi:hypothetical protein